MTAQDGKTAKLNRKITMYLCLFAIRFEGDSAKKLKSTREIGQQETGARLNFILFFFCSPVLLISLSHEI